MRDSRLLLIDGNALIHRAFHAVPPLTTSSGELTNAVFGFANIVLKEMEELRPTHVAMAMDRPSPTFRHEAYAGYKATRPSTPQPLTSQFQRVRQLAEAMHIPIYELDGFEADDVLGTLALQAEHERVPTVIVTGDLDALQLVSDTVQVLTPARGITDTAMYDRAAVQQRYGLDPEQLPDWKALVGDTSDNIPGVPGIGAKTASALLARFRSLDELYSHLEEVNAKQRDALGAHRDQAFASRDLARIVRDTPVTLSLASCATDDIDRVTLINLFRELEFRTLIERIQSMMPAGAVPASPTTAQQLDLFAGDDGGSVVTRPTVIERSFGTPPETITHVVRSEDDLAGMIAALNAAGRFAVDTETTSTDPLQARLVGLSFAVDGERAWYVPVGHAEGPQLSLPTVIDALAPVLEDRNASKVGHNLKYDYAVLRRHGIQMNGLDYDTMIAAYLINPIARGGLSLSSLALSRLGIEMTPIEELIGKGKNQLTMDRVDIERVARYAGADAAVTLRLCDVLTEALSERQLQDLFRQVEMPLVPVLADMELTGVALDTDVLTEMSRDMTEVLGRLEASIYERAGHRFNINSTQQLGQVLFNELQLPSGRRTKTGHSTDSEVLENLRGRHEIVDEILEYRQLIKLKNTYVDALPSLISPTDSKVHTDFNQTSVATGRLSSSNPNLQNIPIRGEIGRKIRRAFVPSRVDNILLAADYSQIELRVLASMSRDPRLLEAFLAGEDIHRATAAAVFGLPLEKVTPDQRRIAKVVNFGIIYGIGEQRLAHETGISRDEAAEFIANYNLTYAGVKEFMDGLRKQAAFSGYVSTLLNRRRYIPDIHSNHPGVRAAAERAAINMPVQGTAADIIKVAMIRLNEQLADRFPGARMVLQVHDELVFDVPRGDLEEVAELVRETMEKAVELSVPLEVEVKAGPDWYDMEQIESAA